MGVEQLKQQWDSLHGTPQSEAVELEARLRELHNELRSIALRSHKLSEGTHNQVAESVGLLLEAAAESLVAPIGLIATANEVASVYSNDFLK
jgi:hypothetical protein